jgi:hypothetical protein
LAFIPVCCYFRPFRPSYLSQHPIFEHPQPVFSVQCETPSFKATWTTGRTVVPCSVICMVLDRKLKDGKSLTEW